MMEEIDSLKYRISVLEYIVMNLMIKWVNDGEDESVVVTEGE
jgi:hypothetical protein